MNIKANKSIYTIVGALLFVLMAFTPAFSSTIEFAGNDNHKGVHLHSNGRINFMWVPITTPDSTGGDPVADSYWGALDIRVFDAIGGSAGDLSVGDSYDGFDYSFAMYVVDKYNKSGIHANDKKTPNYAQFAGAMHLTSISFPSDYEINLSGYVDNTTNNLLASSALSDLQNDGSINFALNIVANQKTAGSFVDVLNSGNKSSWANISGSLGPGMTPGGGAVPEPSTFVLFSSVLAVGAWIKRRRGTLEA